jgi:1,4-dihydroxy-2-naphthoyl-CoA hydrolase
VNSDLFIVFTLYYFLKSLRISPNLPYQLQRTVTFRDTDAAGVVYFACVLTMCHEAYETSLAASGIALADFFGKSPIAVPIVHASVDFRQPLYCGDHLHIDLSVSADLDEITLAKFPPNQSFTLQYHIWRNGDRSRPAAQAITRHCAIDTATRRRCDLSPALQAWLATVRP